MDDREKISKMVTKRLGECIRESILKYDIVDKQLLSWMEAKAENQNMVFTDAILLKKVSIIAQENNFTEFKASLGWLGKFKKRHSLSLKPTYGEGKNNEFTDEDKDFFYAQIRGKVAEYGKYNVFNADETGLFYRQMPTKTISAKVRQGVKIFKDRVSVLLCCNMDGNVKIRLLVIGRAPHNGAIKRRLNSL